MNTREDDPTREAGLPGVSVGHRLALPGTLWASAAILVTAASVAAAQLPATTNSLMARAERLYSEAKARYQGAPTNATEAWHFARACFDWAECATNNSQRAAVAKEGLRVSGALVAQQPGLGPAYYYLGLNLGQLARTQSVGALASVGDMEKALEHARVLDAPFDYAGPDRTLGLLYRDAPGWLVSIGSRAKARRHLEKAVELSPAYPENRLNLLEACQHWHDEAGARREYTALAKLLPQARASFTGEIWAASWVDWDQRWRAILARLKPEPPDQGSREKAR